MAIGQAIQTKYQGFRFRSRTEAKWAVFLNSLGVKWDYEVEGFKLPSGYYLPDFLLTGIKAWVEIKGKEPSDHERQLCRELAELVEPNWPVFLFWGSVPGHDGENDSGMVFWKGAEESQQAFCACPVCGMVGIEYRGRFDRLSCNCVNGIANDQLKIRSAIDAARSARFEHGERG